MERRFDSLLSRAERKGKNPRWLVPRAAISKAHTPCPPLSCSRDFFIAKMTAGILDWEAKGEGLACVWHGLPFMPAAQREATEITCPVYSGLETSRPWLCLLKVRSASFRTQPGCSMSVGL